MTYSDEEIRDKYMAALKMNTIPKNKPLGNGYITDENQSVKWNRERVEESHRLYKEERDRLKEAQNKALQGAKNLYIESIIEYMNIGGRPISRGGAAKLLEKIIEYSDNDMFQFDSYISDFYDIRNLD